MLAVLALTSCHGVATEVPHKTAIEMETSGATPGESDRKVALISFYHEPLVIEVPTQAIAAQPFNVYVTTYSGGCIRDDTIQVSVSSSRADVVPFQRIYSLGPNEACTAELNIRRRPVSVTLSKPGESVVRITGRARPGDSLVVVTKTLTIK